MSQFPQRDYVVNLTKQANPVLESKKPSRFLSTKRYDHSVGLSACFRQWRAKSHCRFLHGYALAFEFTFEATELDRNGWVVDFGGLKQLKAALEDTFDHKMLVAKDDPDLVIFRSMDNAGLSQIMVVDRVGVESFAQLAFREAANLINDDRVQVIKAQCWEHPGNSAIYEEDFSL